VGGIPPQPPAAIEAPNAARTRITLPVVTTPTVLHLILEVGDAGTPPLTRYRRVIIDVRP
jgi:hypothetical protein